MADNKNTRFAFTAYEKQYAVVDQAQTDVELVKMLMYQEEVCPTTGRKHRQGCLQTQLPVRMSRVRALLPGVHVEVSRDWNKLVNYCRKQETRDVSGNSVHVMNPHVERKKVSDFLDDIADIVWGNWEMEQLCPASDRDYNDPPDHPTRSTPDAIKEEYWDAVRHIVAGNPEAIGILAQPLPQNAWKNTRQVWLDRAKQRVDEQGQ